MWRRHGDALFALLVLGGFTLQATGLAFLTWSFVVRSSNPAAVGPEEVLVASVVAVGLVLLAIVTFILGYHAFSARRDARRQVHRARWAERWTRVAFGAESPPPGPLSALTLDALLDVRETLLDEQGRRLDAVLQRPSVVLSLTDALRSWRLTVRLETLDRLARARLPSTLYPILDVIGDDRASVRLMAVRAAARALARLPGGPALDRAAATFAKSLGRVPLPQGIILEGLMLSEEAAAPVIRRLLREDPLLNGSSQRTRWAALEAAGRLELLDLADEVAAFIKHEDPELRAAALRALGRMGHLPVMAVLSVALALSDEVDFVRVQATRVAGLLTSRVAIPRLWKRLGDRSWWVRRTAAETLLQHGSEGQEALARAAREHDDRYARHMAVQSLLDAKRIDTDTARRLRESA